MTPDPEPNRAIRALDRKRSMGEPNADREEIPDFLEVQGWMVRIGFQELEILLG